MGQALVVFFWLRQVSGAQEMLIFISLVQTCLKLAIFIFPTQIFKMFSELSLSSLSDLSQLSLRYLAQVSLRSLLFPSQHKRISPSSSSDSWTLKRLIRQLFRLRKALRKTVNVFFPIKTCVTTKTSRWVLCFQS